MAITEARVNRITQHTTRNMHTGEGTYCVMMVLWWETT
jgi:hypothetical protein